MTWRQERYFQVYKPLLECKDLRHEFQFLVSNMCKEGDLGSRTLTCSLSHSFTKGFVKVYQTISSLQHFRLLKQALKSDSKMK